MTREQENLEKNISRLVKQTRDSAYPGRAFADTLTDEALAELERQLAEPRGRKDTIVNAARLLALAAAILIIAGVLLVTLLPSSAVKETGNVATTIGVKTNEETATLLMERKEAEEARAKSAATPLSSDDEARRASGLAGDLEENETVSAVSGDTRGRADAAGEKFRSVQVEANTAAPLPAITGREVAAAPTLGTAAKTDVPSMSLAGETHAGLAPSEKPASIPVPLVLPGATFIGTPQNVAGVTNLEKPRIGARPVFYVPEGTTNVALGKAVASSDSAPIIGSIEMITDGDKEATDGSYVELGPGVQYVTIDLNCPHDIYALSLWHYHKTPRVYFDVIVQVADDPDFITNVRTLFNNDMDNSIGQGIGANLNYIDNFEGKLIDAKGVRARYVRLYSNGNNANDLNHYVEVEVFGKTTGEEP